MTPPMTTPRVHASAPSTLVDRLARSQVAIATLGAELQRLATWGRTFADRLSRGGRLLAAGNGGSAALAQHLVGELVGRFEAERAPYSGLALCSETAGLTAIGNDYGFEDCFARQVVAHDAHGRAPRRHDGCPCSPTTASNAAQSRWTATWCASWIAAVEVAGTTSASCAASASALGLGPVMAHTSRPLVRAVSAARTRLGLRPDVDRVSSTSPSRPWATT